MACVVLTIFHISSIWKPDGTISTNRGFVRGTRKAIQSGVYVGRVLMLRVPSAGDPCLGEESSLSRLILSMSDSVSIPAWTSDYQGSAESTPETANTRNGGSYHENTRKRFNYQQPALGTSKLVNRSETFFFSLTAGFRQDRRASAWNRLFGGSVWGGMQPQRSVSVTDNLPGEREASLPFP